MYTRFELYVAMSPGFRFSVLSAHHPSSKTGLISKSTLDINIQFELNLKWMLTKRPTRWWSFVLMLWGSSNVSSANGEYVTGLLVNTSPPIEKKILSLWTQLFHVCPDFVKEVWISLNSNKISMKSLLLLFQPTYMIVWIETLFKVWWSMISIHQGA